MTIAISSVSNNQTFGAWLTTTNRLVELMSQNVVTSDSSNGGSITTGNSFVNGYFGAEYVYVANTLSGGNVSSNGVLRLQANVAFTSGTSNLVVILSNGNVGIGNSAPVTTLHVTGNTRIDGSLSGSLASFLANATNITSGTLATARLSGTYAITANNANNLDGQPASFYTNATNITTGTLATARLSGTYDITANNATNLNGQAASFYTNATNITTGTLETARLPATANISTAVNIGSNALTVGTSAFFVANGNVGIGTSSPASPLHIEGDARVSSINNGPLAGFRNAIINGNFDFWQRGITGSAAGYVADRFAIISNGTTTVQTRQAFTIGQTDVPNEPTYFHRTAVTSVTGAGNFALLSQRIEDVRTFATQLVTLTFWAKAEASKNIAVEFQQVFGTGGSPSSSVTFGVTTCALTTSWQRFTVTTTGPSISGKTLGSAGNNNLQIAFWFDADSNFNSRTNSLGQQSGTFDIAQVQLEPGPVATPFERRPIGTELALCQRYYWTGAARAGGTSQVASAALAENWIAFPSQMRIIPTLTAGTPTLINAAAFTADDPRVNGFRALVQSNAAITNYAGSANVTAGAEL
jgi:hypothetical protein